MTRIDPDTFGSDDDPERPLPELLRARACPAGLPHTGDDPAADHGHTDCWLIHRAAARIEELEEAVLDAFVPLASTTARQPVTSLHARDRLAEVVLDGEGRPRRWVEALVREQLRRRDQALMDVLLYGQHVVAEDEHGVRRRVDPRDVQTRGESTTADGDGLDGT